MTILGVLIWLVLSGIIIGIFVWSTRILMAQKKAWAAFAKKHGLIYTKGRFFSSPVMSGFIGDYRFGFFSEEKQTQDIKDRRYVTVVEMQLPNGLVDGGVAGTTGMLPFMQTLDLIHPYKPKTENWDNRFHMHVRDNAVIDEYWTPVRMEALKKILGTKNAEAMLMFDDKEAVIRLETPDPLQDPAKIEKTVQRLTRHAQELR